MTQDDIIRMAREAGLEQVVAINPKDGGIITKSLPPELLERFAALVVAHEREACAKWCEKLAALNTATPQNIVAAIRARGDK